MKNYKNWDINYAKKWKYFPSPARPSKDEIGIFAKYLNFYQKNKTGKIKVLILGSTPELRDLCNQKKIETYCLDINKDVYQALSLLLKDKNKHEHFIQINWLDYKSPVKFDLIFGDAVNNVLSLKDYLQFFKRLSLLIRPGGLLIFRSIIQNPNFDISPQESFRRYRRFYRPREINIYTSTFNNMAMYYLDKNTNEISPKDIYEHLKDLLERKVIKQSEFVELSKYYYKVALKISIPEENFLMNIVNKYFRIVAKEFGLDYFASLNNPVYIAKKDFH